MGPTERPVKKERKATIQIQTSGITKFKKKVDGPALAFKAKSAEETRHLASFGVNLAEELNDRYNTEHILHVLHRDTALVDFYKFMGN